MKIRNFLFHRVSDETDKLWPPMKPAYFEDVIRHLKKNYTVVGLEEYLGDRTAYSKAKNLVTVLFDDGYKDNIEYAAPILQKYKCPASFYVVSDCISENLPTWTYILDDLFQQTKKMDLVLDFDWIPADKRVNRFSTIEERLAFGSWLKPSLKKLKNTQRVATYRAVQTAFSDVVIPRDKMMNWADVNELRTAGFHIGSHSVTHPLLATIEDMDDLGRELKVSALEIEKHTGHYPETISYPIGSYSSVVMEQSKKAGYKYGLAVDQRFYVEGKDDVMSIPRVELYNEPRWKTLMRITGAMTSLKKILR